MALDLIAILGEAGVLALFAVALGIVVFPLVLVMSFFYDFLVKKYEKIPKFVFMLACCIIGAFIALVIIELYLGNALTQILSVQCA